MAKSKRQKGLRPAKRRKRKSGSAFPEDRKEYLLDRDAGSWYDQATIEHRQKLLNSEGIDSLTIRSATAPSTSILSSTSNISGVDTISSSNNSGNEASRISSPVSSSTPPENLCSSAQKIHSARKRMLNLECIDSESDSEDEEDDLPVNENENAKNAILSPPQNLWIIDLQLLQRTLNNSMCCKSCQGPVQIFEVVKARQGLGTKMQLRCENSVCPSLETVHLFDTTEKKKGENKYEINEKNVLANRLIGRGRAHSEKFCSILGLTRPIRRPAWKKHATKIDEASIAAKDESIKRAADRVKDMQPDTDTSMVEIPTSFDASWSKRGWSSRDGLVTAIADDTSQVLDVLHLANSCPQCTELTNLMEQGKLSSTEHMERYLKHEELCCVNHEGSSSSMETVGVQRLFERSEEDLGVRYNPYIGDGDSSSYNNIDLVRPYGQSVFIKKDECVGHVTKRMGTGLREVTKTEKGRKLSDGKPISGKGRLTIARIDTFQAFYGRAIRDNKGDAKAMSKATMAILDHYSSTLEEPKHDNCPVGEKSWCSYQRSLISGDVNDHIPIKNPIVPAIYDRIKPVFDRLSSVTFLEGCVNAYTQNANESLHHVIWGLAPKDQSQSSQDIRTAINVGVCLFNDGFEMTLSEIFKQLKISSSAHQHDLWRSIDEDRIKYVQYGNSEKRKKHRKIMRRKRCKRQDAFQHAEGMRHYESNKFYKE